MSNIARQKLSWPSVSASIENWKMGIISLLYTIEYGIKIFWDVTESNFETFLIPVTLFGVFGALSGPELTSITMASSVLILQRVPLVLAFVWTNLLVFDLAGQRLSRAEDLLNKPKRPIPSGRLMPLGMRRILLATIPCTLAANYVLGVWKQTGLLIVLSWMYSDLGGGDENFLIRNLIIAMAFGMYNFGSLQVSCGPGCTLYSRSYYWLALTSAVTFSTMSIQDLRDQAGDKVRGRLTAPLVLGDMSARWIIIVPMVVFSVICPLYLGTGLIGFMLPVGLSLVVTRSMLYSRSSKDDNTTYSIWAGWLISIYALPLFKNNDALW